jgi:hypothetical protein
MSMNNIIRSVVGKILLITWAFTSFASCKNTFEKPNLVAVKDKKESIDVLDMLYTIAEQKGMRVITDLNMSGGELYSTYTTSQVISKQKTFITQYHKRYGNHKSFWGWYINNELNPLKPDEVEKSAFWRTVWKAAVTECHAVAPSSKVTISPFFLLDKQGLRGFEYLEPLVYEQWWGRTLKETGIDILMIQDSGAEHLSFFTIADREPFLAAFEKACIAAGSKLWINVETGQVDAVDWVDALQQERTKQQKWVFPEMNFLEKKLKLAAKYGQEIISWGHYPFMNAKVNPSLTLTDNIPLSTLQANYNAYKNYYTNFPINYTLQPGEQTKPLINGSLWWMPVGYDNMTKVQIEQLIEEQVDQQKQLGYNLIWIVNAPAHMEWAIKNR